MEGRLPDNVDLSTLGPLLTDLQSNSFFVLMVLLTNFSLAPKKKYDKYAICATDGKTYPCILSDLEKPLYQNPTNPIESFSPRHETQNDDLHATDVAEYISKKLYERPNQKEYVLDDKSPNKGQKYDEYGLDDTKYAGNIGFDANDNPLLKPISYESDVINSYPYDLDKKPYQIPKYETRPKDNNDINPNNLAEYIKTLHQKPNQNGYGLEGKSAINNVIKTPEPGQKSDSFGLDDTKYNGNIGFDANDYSNNPLSKPTYYYESESYPPNFGKKPYQSPKYNKYVSSESSSQENIGFDSNYETKDNEYNNIGSGGKIQLKTEKGSVNFGNVYKNMNGKNHNSIDYDNPGNNGNKLYPVLGISGLRISDAKLKKKV